MLFKRKQSAVQVRKLAHNLNSIKKPNPTWLEMAEATKSSACRLEKHGGSFCAASLNAWPLRCCDQWEKQLARNSAPSVLAKIKSEQE